MTTTFDQLASIDVLTRTEKALAEHNFLPETVRDGS